MDWYPPYVPVGARRARAMLELRDLRARGVEVQPVEIKGRAIARSFSGFAEFRSLRRKPLCSMHLRATLRYCQPILPAESDGLSTAFKDASY